MTIAKLPLVKEVTGLDFAATPESLVKDLATGGFLTSQRKTVLVGGTDKTHLVIAIGRVCGAAVPGAGSTTLSTW